MIDDPKILDELQKINRNLENQNNLLKNASRSFTSGIFSALGSLFGTVVVAALIIYVLSKLNFTKNFSDTLEKFVSNRTSTNAQLVVPSPGQP